MIRMTKGKKGQKQEGQLKKLLNLFNNDFKAIDGHPMVVIASGGVRRGLEAMVGCRFVGHPGMPGNIVQAAAKCNSSLYLLKECLALVAIDRIINPTSLSSGSRPKRRSVSRRIRKVSWQVLVSLIGIWLFASREDLAYSTTSSLWLLALRMPKVLKLHDSGRLQFSETCVRHAPHGL